MKKQKTFASQVLAMDWLVNISNAFEISTAHVRKHKVNPRGFSEDRWVVDVSFK